MAIGVKLLFPVLMMAAVVASSGCVSVDPTAFAKTLPMVQEFLDQHPNARINIVHYSAAEAESILDLIKEDCGKLSVEPKEYYFVNITDPSTDLVVRAWIDWETQTVECIYKEGTSTDPQDCTSLYEAKCFGDHVYWFDSCGNREEKKEYCPLGCSNGECVQGKTCDVSTSYTEKPDCVCPDGYEMIQLYERCVDSVTGDVTGMPFAVTEQVADKAVTIEDGSVEISPEFTTEYEERCPGTNPVYRCVKQVQCRSHAQAKCYKDSVYWFDSCGHVQEKKEYCNNGCENGFCKENQANKCEASGGYCVYPEVTGCTEDAKVCADGTVLSRQAPDCDFPECPETCDTVNDDGSCNDSAENDSTVEAHAEEEKFVTDYPSCREGYAKSGDYWCPDKGVCCLPEEIENTCSENDDGYDIYNYGCAATPNQRLCDHCNSDGTLTEKYCKDGSIQAKTVSCPDGYECEDAACVKQECVQEGGYMQGTVSPEYQTRCCEGLEGFDTSGGLLGAPLLCYDPEKGQPQCKYGGTEDEGWYYPDDEVLVYEECDSIECVESWTCGEWGECVAGNQTRSCYDTNNCTTQENRPEEVMQCCVPATCSDMGYTCGTYSDGCDGIMYCGNCTAGYSCLGGQCVCTPTTCSALGFECGNASDGCDGILDCGGCPSGQACNSENQCECVPTSTCGTYDCGAYWNGCTYLNCGDCSDLPGYYVCVDRTCVNSGGL